MQKKNKKIGILGGTFNPVHKGHIALGTAAYEQFGLDKIWVMVSKTPPHKSSADMPDAEVRSDMVKLAIADYPFMEYSDFELQREGTIYTADTLTLLADKYPENEYYFILGGDSLAYFEHWYHPEIILEHAVILASGRDDIKEEVLDREIAELKNLFAHADIRKIHFQEYPCSSTQIRKDMEAHRDVSRWVHPDVQVYIRAHHLYDV